MKNVNKLRESSNFNKGVTLIALIITIIVLLILAGITIAMVVGDNGIIAKAGTAKTKTNESQDAELQQLDSYEKQIDTLGRAGLGKPDLIYSGSTTQLKKYNLIEGKSIQNYNYLLIQANDYDRSNYKQYSNLIPVIDIDKTQDHDIKIAGYGTCGANIHFDSDTSFVIDNWCGSAFYIQKIYGIN